MLTVQGSIRSLPARGHITGLNSGMMKMIFSTNTRRLLGVHVPGEGATKLIHSRLASAASKRLQFPIREPHHFQQQPAVYCP
jgi:pyruvate/2-oxoglutarate dehydrogenase complex dihydrolipoamide dehydrogenase (E3) component